MIHTGDCLDVMATFDAESIDAIVTDPPYGLEFMGKAWDHGVIGRPFAEAMLRVAKPSAYLLAFGGTRTVHRMTVALEDAGWIIRDMLVWAYASGFPKSKASLKPAWEPIVMARKPGPLRMLAIDECRIQSQPRTTHADGNRVGNRNGASSYRIGEEGYAYEGAAGRWPANVILTDPIFDGGWDGVVGGGEAPSAGVYRRPDEPKNAGERGGRTGDGIFEEWAGRDYRRDNAYGGDSGTYSRFFLIPKADRSDREPVLGGLPEQHAATASRMVDFSDPRMDRPQVRRARANVHPTVKPVDLMRHLVRLVTPAGGLVLDPFLGSGTTGLAAEMEGFPWVGIEKEPEYVAIAEARLNGTQRGLGLVG